MFSPGGLRFSVGGAGGMPAAAILPAIACSFSSVAVFYIQLGKVKLTVVSEQGKEAMIAILGPGQFSRKR
jgi:hypothetical protein